MVNGNNTFEGGTEGATLVASPNNTGGGSGTPFDAVFGTGMIFRAAAALFGSMGVRVLAGNSGAGVWNLGGSSKVSGKIFFRVPGVTSGDMYLHRVNDSTGARLFDIHINVLGKLRVDDATGTSGVFTYANVLTASQIYRLEYYLVAGTTTSNGTIKVAYYKGTSTTAEESVYLNTAANLGAGSLFDKAYFGSYGNSGTVDLDIDNAAFDTTLSDFIGIPASSPPTVSTPANQNVTASAPVSASVTASSSSGTIQSYAWSVIYSSTGSNPPGWPSPANTASVNFTATSDTTKGHLYILQCIVTDSNGLTTPVTTEVRVPTSGDATVLPGTASASVGSWANVGGAATPGDALGDTSDTTYLESPALTSSAVSVRYRLAPITARSALNLTVRVCQDTTGSTTDVVSLYEGSTLRQSWTLPTITTSFADYVVSVTSPGAITDGGNLYVAAGATSP